MVNIDNEYIEKYRLCYNHIKYPFCKYGDNCEYKHAHKNVCLFLSKCKMFFYDGYKCKYYHGLCPKGYECEIKNCFFDHPNGICIYYINNGKCLNIKECKLDHIDPPKYK